MDRPSTNNTGGPANSSTDSVESWEVIGYSLVIPMVCGVGVVANACSLIVLVKGADHLKESLYTYLKVLSVADLVTVFLVFLSGLARGVWVDSFFWRCFDELFHLPVGSISSSVSITTLVAVTAERVAIIKAPLGFRVYCTPLFARKLCAANVVFSLIFNIPYFLTFTLRDGELVYSEFVQSRYYAVHNWFRLALLGLIPAVSLLLGNLLLLHSLWRPRGPFIPARLLASLADQRRLTWVLVAMICSFLLGEFPTHIASRSSAVTLLFLGRPDLLYTSSFRVFKLVVTILMSLHYSVNFFLYCAFNKRFALELQRILSDSLKCSRNNTSLGRVAPSTMMASAQIPLRIAAPNYETAPFTTAAQRQMS
ncbi:probable G-protein coupled receptor B0563.6 [Macrobrachium nipponense]|uniref:probable G-protein coupled receptor B0563.6 n=1 Tax=Macrobrachium nipponense TaxID=159736 RepID=UPI0030C8B07B